MAKIDSKVYDQNVLKEGPQFQIDKFYEPQDEQMKRRIRIIMDLAEPEKGGRILDVGCGVGTFAFHCARHNLFSVGMDYSLESVKTAIALCDRFRVSDKAKFIVGSGAGFPFKDCCFDKIIAADFIEHITQEEKGCFLKEAFRVLKPGGKIIVFTPNGSREKIGELYWRLRNVLLNDKIPHTDLHFGLTTKREFEALLKNHRLTFNLHYRDVVRPYLAFIPLVRSLLALNLIWVIQKEIPDYFPDFADSCYYFRAAGVRARKVIRSFYLALRHAALLPFLIFRKFVVFKPEDIKKILVGRYDRIGDMVLSTPFFEGLKKRFPTAQVTVIASPANKEIIERNPYIDAIEVYHGARWFRERFANEAIDLGIDLFLTYQLKQPWLLFFTKAGHRVGFENAGRELFFNLHGPSLNNTVSMREHISELAASLGMDIKNIRPQIYLSDEETAWGKERLLAEGFSEDGLKIVLHPGGHYPSQRWGVENFAELAKKIAQRFSVKVILLGAKSEEGLLQKITSGLESAQFTVFSDLSLRQTMALLSQCSLLVCNNSGPLHIAAAFNRPTVSLVGPTDPVLWMPDGKNDVVIRKGLLCSPCSRAECRTHTCMKLISGDEVFAAIVNLVQKVYGRTAQ